MSHPVSQLPPHPGPATAPRVGRMLAGLLLGLSLLAGSPPAQGTPDDEAIEATFSALLGAINAGSPSGVTAHIPREQTAYFKLKGVVDAHLTAEKAVKKLQEWFDAGGKGPGWKQKGERAGLTCRYHRKDGRDLTITLRKVGSRYYLSSIIERG